MKKAYSVTLSIQQVVTYSSTVDVVLEVDDAVTEQGANLRLSEMNHDFEARASKNLASKDPTELDKLLANAYFDRDDTGSYDLADVAYHVDIESIVLDNLDAGDPA